MARLCRQQNPAATEDTYGTGCCAGKDYRAIPDNLPNFHYWLMFEDDEP